MLKRAYVRILLDDDTYTTTFPRVSLMDLTESDDQIDDSEEEEENEDISQDEQQNRSAANQDNNEKSASLPRQKRHPKAPSDYLKLVWDQQIFVKLGPAQRDLTETSIYIMLCVNTEDEISFIDKMLANFEIKMGEYVDQRQRVVKLDVVEENSVEASRSDLSSADIPQFVVSVRLCYSRVKFQESLIADLSALIVKEHEYLYYLQNCVNAIDEVITKTQAAVRGYLVRSKLKK